MVRQKKADIAAAAAAAAPVPSIEQQVAQLDDSVPRNIDVEISAFLALRDSVRISSSSMPS